MQTRKAGANDDNIVMTEWLLGNRRFRHDDACLGNVIVALWQKYSSFGPYQRMRYLLKACALTMLTNSSGLWAAQLSPFTSDGCSAFPNGTAQQHDLWLGCCLAHDAAYWAGGSFEQRSQADQALRQCVASQGEQAIAWLMLMGVSVGGSAFWPTNFRWGYGWPYLRGYQQLNAAELKQVRAGWPAGVALPPSLQTDTNREEQ